MPGQAAHGAVRREGVSALANFILLYRELEAFERERNCNVPDPRFRAYTHPYSLSIGIMRGGEWASSVPDRVVAEGRFGVAVDESVAAARRAFEARIAAACQRTRFLRKHPAKVTWWGGQFAPCETPADARIAQVALGVGRDMDLGRGPGRDGEGAASKSGQPAGAGSPPEGDGVYGVPYGSDLRHLVNAGGTPGILFGPGDIAGAHRENESVSVEELVDGARATALVVLRFLGRQR